MSSGDRYADHSKKASNNVPDFLISSVPYLNNVHNHISNIPNDTINPYSPASSTRRVSGASIKSEDLRSIKKTPQKSFASDGDTSKFDFEPLHSPTTPVRTQSNLLPSSPPGSAGPAPTLTPQRSDLYAVQSSPSASNISFHTAHSLQSNNEEGKGTRLTPSPKLTIPFRSRSTSPKIPLKIETSTPSKSLLNDLETSEQSIGDQFSFFNTSQAQHPDSSTSSHNKDHRSTVFKNSPHSRNSSLSWEVNNPEEWTMERVVFWLELNQFNESWIRVFKNHSLVGKKFLSLTNYQNIKQYKSELETSNDSTQSKFIHLLRKTLEIPNSASTINALSPPSINSSFDSLESSPLSQDLGHSGSASETDPASGTLLPTLSAPAPVVSSHKCASQSASTLQIVPANQIRKVKHIPKQRPASTIESSSKNMWASSPVSPAIPYGLFRRHKKSSSSESSLFTSLFSPSTGNLPQSSTDRKQSEPNESKGLLNKWRKKTERSKSRDRDTSPVSPSTVSKSLRTPTSAVSVSLPKKSERDIKRKPPPARNKHKDTIPPSQPSSLLPSFTLDKKFLPIPQNSNSDQYLLVTKDNLNFKMVNIGACKDVDSLKSTLIQTIFPNSVEGCLHFTEFGCIAGEELDDQSLDILLKNSFSNCSGKILVSTTDEPSPVMSPSDTVSFETKDDGKVYPDTPQHFYDIGKSGSKEIDYLNFKESAINDTSIDLARETAQQSQQSKQELLTSTSKTMIPIKSEIFVPLLNSPPKKTITKASSFRVIRPNEIGEINFDKRRESPFTNKTNLIARRTAPRPPLRKPVSQTTIMEPTLTPVRESDVKEGTYVSTYTPGSSNILIPEPYKGTSISPSAQRKTFDWESKHEEETKPRSELQRKKTIGRSFTRKRSKHVTDKFQENVISFDDAPSLDDETSNSDSDDGFWAKAPEDIKKDDSKVAPGISKMIVRPAPEVLYDNLEKFFPNANLDQPVVDVLSPPVSPSNETANDSSDEPSPKIKKKVVTSTSSDDDRFLKPHRVKTIRAVAREASEARKRESFQRSSFNSNEKPLLRRQSTKMWGRKVVEVKPNQIQNISRLSSKKSKNSITQFSWIRGELIGKGTFGNVYLALNITTGEMIAVKQVSIPEKGMAKSSEVIDALHSEVETLKDLDHLNIVQYLGFEKTDKHYNLFLEYVAGGSVASCLRLYGKFDEPLIRFLTLQVLEGLAYLHSRGILHRDMKADNLLLDLDGVCKISDFGISKKSSDIYANNAAMSMQGTIFWMAPEVVDSREGYSAKVDIWSLGCVVLEMFAGRRPWSNLEAITAMFKIGKAKAAPPIPDDVLPHVSQEGLKFLDCCFAIDANKRPTAQQLRKDPFCKIDKNFTFASTKLAALIKSNEKKITGLKHGVKR